MVNRTIRFSVFCEQSAVAANWRLSTANFASITLFCMMLLAGCATAPRATIHAGPEEECREAFRRVDRAVAAAGVQDGMAARVAGFPYLRVNRFLAS